MAFLDLPVLVIENIFSYLTYDEVAKNRLVSKSFNEICMKLLNRGFLMIERRHALALKSVKAQLPRRESERRYHPLARHCDILTSIETRISMLNMTYSKFIDVGLCCFIPGRVIDEIRRVLYIVESSKQPPRAHEVLQELRDISSMAIEHFDDKISPEFRKRLHEGSSGATARTVQSVGESAMTPLAVRQELAQMRRSSALNAKLSLYLASQYKTFYKRMMMYRSVAWTQSRSIRELTRRQKDQDATIADLKKRIEECDIKYSELTHTNQAAGGKGMASTTSDGAGNGQPLRHFGSQIKLDLSVLPIGTSKRGGKALPNIKPRKPLIKLPSLSDDEPSTSNPQNKALATLSKIRGITNEIRQLSNLSKSLEGRKRPNTGEDEVEIKMKRDESDVSAVKFKID